MGSKTKRCRICRIPRDKKEFSVNPRTGKRRRRCDHCGERMRGGENIQRAPRVAA